MPRRRAGCVPRFANEGRTQTVQSTEIAGQTKKIAQHMNLSVGGSTKRSWAPLKALLNPAGRQDGDPDNQWKEMLK
ncbi:hypothetical protein [Mesorhizobium sp. J8]|uniref:hypothetical protein n=1 Tax=Mesorhizobium sp. J8 TaxID=2777475 RepID=UPI0019155DD0|nr:hypothetical protein [Mesorhizobium sp. J8]